MTSPRLRLVATCLTLASLIACGPSGPSGTEPIAHLRIALSEGAVVGSNVAVTITAVGSAGSDPLTSFNGTVSLEVSDGTMTPSTISVTAGTAETTVRFDGVVATVVVTARAGSAEGSATIELLPLTAVPGSASAPAASALPRLEYRPRDQDYATDATDLPGTDLSFTTMTAVWDANATIGQVNALLARHEAGIVGAVPGLVGTHGPIVVVRVPATSHADMLPRLTAYRAEPLVLNAHRELRPPPQVPFAGLPSATVDPSRVTKPNAGEPPNWTWQVPGAERPDPDANWGLEDARVPQAWNFAAFGARSVAAVGGKIATGVLDTGFPDHAGDDLVFSERLGVFVAVPLADNDHGLHVAGTIGASVGNGVGVDGVAPFAGLVARRYDGGLNWGAKEFIEARPGLRVLNLSLGNNWYRYVDVAMRDPNNNAAIQDQMISEGATFHAFLEVRRASGLPVPVIVVAAGNDSGGPPGRIEARWSSAATAAALLFDDPDVLVVMSGQRLDTLSATGLASSSNDGGHVVAPGVGIWSTAASTPYMPMSGTSMATPHVSGLASYLFALDPTLTNAEVITAIRASAREEWVGEPFIDAFNAVLALDVVRGNVTTMLRALVDVDDGTLDGNLRVDLRTDAEFPFDSGDQFGPLGDGTVDMRDFRRFRDALLLVEGSPDLELDGANDHPKRDLNLDGRVQTPALENVYPRYDFNGDGIISRTATAFVGGVLQAELTDLQVLQAVWQDPMVDADALPALLDSGDVHVDLDDAFFELGAVAAEVTFTHVDSESVVATVTLEALRQHVTTLPVGAYDVDVTYFGAGGAPLATGADRVAVGLGGDVAARLDPRRAPRAVALHIIHGLLVRSNGDVVAWGVNTNGQVGDGTTTFRPVAVTVPGLTDVENVQANWLMSVARLQDGRVASWGAGYLGNGSVSTEQTTPVFATGLTNALAIGVGYYHTLALRADGTVVGWGYNQFGQLGIGSTDPPLVPAVMDGVTNAIGIAAGGRHTLVLLGDGTVLAVGDNFRGQLGNGSVWLPGDPPATTVAAVPGIAGAVAVAAANHLFGRDSSFALLNDGTLRAWGQNDRGQLGDGTNELRTSPVSVPGLAGVTAVSAGADHTLALLSDGTVRAWGANDFGQLGTGGPATGTAVPVMVPGLSDIVTIRAGYEASMAIAADGTVYAWGRNNNGVLGLGDMDQRDAPTPVPGLD